MKQITTALLVLSLAGCDLSLDVASKLEKGARLEVIDIYCRNRILGIDTFGYEIVIDEAREKAIVWEMAYELSDNKWQRKWISHELLDVFVGNQRIFLTGKDSRLMLTATNDLAFPDIDYNLQREPSGVGLTCRNADEKPT